MKKARASGILLHPTSLPGPHGSGDLGAAAYHFVDWLKVAEQTLWQVLPLVGVGPGNSPYMSSSAFAGNVLLIDLIELQEQGWLSEQDILLAPTGSNDTTHEDLSNGRPSHHHAAHKEFDGQRVKFHAVVPWRMARLEQAAGNFAAGATSAQREAFGLFQEQHGAWLEDYALFMSLSDAFGTGDWTTWPMALAKRETTALRQARAAHEERINFWQFCQWCFFRQWQAIKNYANERGIQIIGDAPIFVAHQSADVWAHPELFKLDSTGQPTVVAGVPPDYFSATGQRWGNPIYDWKMHKREDYAWWIERIRHSFVMVDILRIDHFRGFVDYWEIPAQEPTAMNGTWVKGPGASLFKAIRSMLGPLPIIAEDLGILTPEVEALRSQLGYPGMRILHFAFSGSASNAYLPHNYERETVAYTGTHDNNTSQGWWAEIDEGQRQQVRGYLSLQDNEEADIHWRLIEACASSVANTVIFPMPDVLGLGAASRMNLPGAAEGYWAWRFSWEQVHDWHAPRLAEISRRFGRI
jgi:4-alpha-glucanotransferase